MQAFDMTRKFKVSAKGLFSLAFPSDAPIVPVPAPPVQ
jgi:hypothetical protein